MSFEKKQLLNFIIYHRFIFVVSFVFAFLIILPLFVFPLKIGSAYQGINIPHYGPDAHYYLSRGKEVLDGNSLGNMVLKDGKDGGDSFFGYVEYVLVAPFRIFGDGVNVVTLYSFYNFVGVALLVFLIYFFIFQLTNNKLLATVVAVFVVGGYTIITNKSLFFSGYNIYSKTFYPYVSSVVFFLYLNSLVKSLKNKKIKNILLSGIIFGASFYVYVYLWTFSLVLNLVLFLFFIFKKERDSAKIMATIVGVGVFLGLYNVIKTAQFFSDEKNGIINFTVRSELTHAPVFNKMLAVSTLVCIFYALKYRSDKNLPLLLSLNMASWIALNQQIITGRQVQPEHYYWQFVIPIFLITTLYASWFALGRVKLRNFLFIFLFVTVFISTGIGRYFAVNSDLEVKTYEQNYRPIIDYLNSVAEPAVVLAPNNLDGLIVTIYTKHDLFWDSFFAPQVNTDLNVFYDALFVYSYLNKNARDNFVFYYNNILDDKRGDNFSYDKYVYQFIDGYSSGLSYATYFKKYAEGDNAVVSRYSSSTVIFFNGYKAATAGGTDISSILKRRDVRYIIWDKNKNPEWDLAPLADSLIQLVNSNNIYLYQLEIK